MNKQSITHQQEQTNFQVLQNIMTIVDGGKDLQKIAVYLTEDVEWRMVMPKELPIGGVFHGVQQVQKLFENYAQMFHSEWIDRQDIILHENKIIVVGRERACIMPSRETYEADFTSIFTFREARISKFQAFVDSAALLAAYRGD